MEICANPGCVKPGTNKCSACTKKPYCGAKCQTEDWPRHKEECPGHLLKVSKTNLLKADDLLKKHDYVQTLRCADLATTKLKQLKKNIPTTTSTPIPDEFVQLSDEALRIKYNALLYMALHTEALECAKEWYCLHLTKHTHPPAIKASFALIESCIHNKEYSDAVLYAHTTWETITLSRDSHIPDNLRDEFTAHGAHLVAKAAHCLSLNGGMPAEEKQESGREAITMARRALEIHTQLNGRESEYVAQDMLLLASLLDHFSEQENEAITLRKQAKVIFVRVQGNLSPNVATVERNLGNAFSNRSNTAHAAYDLEREMEMLELALPHYREAARIYRAINQVAMADQVLRDAAEDEKQLQQIRSIRAAIRG